jgi:protein SCO1
MLLGSALPRMRLRVFGACLVTLGFLLGEYGSAASGPKTEPDAPQAARPGVSYRGGLVTPPLLKPRFTLTDTAGAPFDFWEKTRGSITLLFFGYTRCPDQCPLHMANIAVALKKAPVDLSDQVKVVFVTTDPSRDSPHALRAWLDRFDERFVGLTGSETAIDTAQRAAGVPIARKTLLAAGDYAVAHASFVVAYTKDNLGHLIYPSGVTQKDWAHDLPRLVNETWSNR